MVLLRRAAWPGFGLALVIGASLVAGCGSGGGSASGSGTVGASSPGQMRILLADAPVDGLEAVNVTFTRIEALYDGEAESRGREDDDRAVTGVEDVDQDEDDQWVTLSSETRTVNLLDYANRPASELFGLVSSNVASGHYKKFRFTLGSVELVVNGATVVPVLEENPVEVESECFVSPEENETLVLDFDASESLEFDGSTYRFEPKLRLLQQDHAGSVTGTVKFQAATPADEFEAKVELVDASGQVVAHTEVEVEFSAPQAAAQAVFVMHAVPPGTYTLRVTGDDDFEGTAGSQVLIQVTAGQAVQTEAVTLSR